MGPRPSDGIPLLEISVRGRLSSRSVRPAAIPSKGVDAARSPSRPCRGLASADIERSRKHRGRRSCSPARRQESAGADALPVIRGRALRGDADRVAGEDPPTGPRGLAARTCSSPKAAACESTRFLSGVLEALPGYASQHSRSTWALHGNGSSFARQQNRLVNAGQPRASLRRRPVQSPTSLVSDSPENRCRNLRRKRPANAIIFFQILGESKSRIGCDIRPPRPTWEGRFAVPMFASRGDETEGPTPLPGRRRVGS